MEGSFLFFTTLNVCLFSLIQTSRISLCARRNSSNFAMASKVFSDLKSSSGHNLDRSIAEKHISDTFSLKPHRPRRNIYHSASVTTLATTLGLSQHHVLAHDQGTDEASTAGHTYSIEHIISEELFFEGIYVAAEEQSKKGPTSRANGGSQAGGVQTNFFISARSQDLQGAGPCVLGIRPCVVVFNGTNLLWQNMSSRLAFLWYLHVFGSASLFILWAILALVGMAGACALPRSLCDALNLANSLLFMGSAFRGAILLLDPYGAHQILSRATLAALHNVPLQLLLWAQVVLTLVTLKGFKLLLFPLKLQCPWVVGGLAASHCTLLLAADLFSLSASLALPLLLQTLSLCWGLPFCVGILIKSLSQRDPHLKSCIPHWNPPQRTERQARRVTSVCAFFGVLCCGLQMYSLLWLYGLLWNWRRFGWGWWLSQFWARILELAWGFSLLVVGSWIFWIPCMGYCHWQGRDKISKGANEKFLWYRLLARMQKRPQSKSDQTWEELIPNNWAKYKLSATNIRNNITSQCADEHCTIVGEHKPDPFVSSCQAGVLGQKLGEHECVLSLIEFDMQLPSPVNLRRSIDDALHHGQHLAGGLFTAPPHCWTDATDRETNDTDTGITTLSPAASLS